MNLDLKIENPKWKYVRKPHDLDPFGIHYIFRFKNGYKASVIKFALGILGGSYGWENDLWELAVIKDGKVHYDNPVAKGDVRGYLTDHEVNELLRQIEKFKKGVNKNE